MGKARKKTKNQRPSVSLDFDAEVEIKPIEAPTRGLCASSPEEEVELKFSQMLVDQTKKDTKDSLARRIFNVHDRSPGEKPFYSAPLNDPIFSINKSRSVPVMISEKEEFTPSQFEIAVYPTIYLPKPENIQETVEGASRAIFRDENHNTINLLMSVPGHRKKIIIRSELQDYIFDEGTINTACSNITAFGIDPTHIIIHPGRIGDIERLCGFVYCENYCKYDTEKRPREDNECWGWYRGMQVVASTTCPINTMIVLNNRRLGHCDTWQKPIAYPCTNLAELRTGAIMFESIGLTLTDVDRVFVIEVLQETSPSPECKINLKDIKLPSNWGQIEDTKNSIFDPIRDNKPHCCSSGSCCNKESPKQEKTKKKKK